MRHRAKDFSRVNHKDTTEAFIGAALGANNDKHLRNFLEELLTESEKLMLGRRLLIARMLLLGVPQNEIRLRLRVSPNTVWKVNKWLVEQLPDYGTALKKTSVSKTGSKSIGKSLYRNYDPLSFTALKKKYPMHFLLFNISDLVFRKK